MFHCFKPLFFSVLIFSFASCGEPEPQKPHPLRRKSPIAIANITHQTSDTYVKIVYGQPYKRGRKIFGELEPYGEVWRTGANEATELTTTGDILFAGEKLEAGTYALFTIPRKDKPWTIILNEELGQWGAFEYDPTHDVLRVDIPAVNTQSVTEVFTIRFSEIEGDSTSIILSWDRTRVAIPVKFIE